MPIIGSLKTVHLMEKEDNLMFHPDPEMQQIKGQLQIGKQVSHDGLQEENSW